MRGTLSKIPPGLSATPPAPFPSAALAPQCAWRARRQPSTSPWHPLKLQPAGLADLWQACREQHTMSIVHIRHDGMAWRTAPFVCPSLAAVLRHCASVPHEIGPVGTEYPKDPRGSNGDTSSMQSTTSDPYDRSKMQTFRCWDWCQYSCSCPAHCTQNDGKAPE